MAGRQTDGKQPGKRKDGRLFRFSRRLPEGTLTITIKDKGKRKVVIPIEAQSVVRLEHKKPDIGIISN